MKQVLIIENCTSSLIKENSSNPEDKYVMSGIFTEFDVLNRNERIYTAEKFLPALDEMKTRLNDFGVVYGELDHPQVFDTSIARTSHIITKANYLSGKNAVHGEIRLLTTTCGKEARSLVDDNCPIFVSSRAAGVTEGNGYVSLKKLFTYDIVADPGFASAKMSSTPLNESLGFKNPKSNFMIYEMTDESKINDLFNMNKNELVTKEQMTEYSKYLATELASTKQQVNEATKNAKIAPEKMVELFAYYEELQKTNEQVVKYLNYLADKFQVVVNENKSLKETTDKLIKHNNYLAENLDKTISNTEMISEKLEKSVNYSEYIAEKLDKNISYSEYVAENVDKNISYGEYLAEKLNRNINYSEYLAESLDNTINYSEYLGENVQTNIAYVEYIAENLDDNISYGTYLAEKLDNTISYTSMITEKLNSNKLNESDAFGNDFPQFETPAEYGLGEEEEEEIIIPGDEDIIVSDEVIETEEETEEEKSEEHEEIMHELGEIEQTLDVIEDEVVELGEDQEEIVDEIEEIENDEEIAEIEEVQEEEKTEDDNIEELEEEELEEEYSESKSESKLDRDINKLIQEASKQKALQNSDLNFLTFLNKSQVDSFNALSEEDQDRVKLHINEGSYFSGKDVIRMISEALSTKNETLEERIVRLMPENIKPVYEGLDTSAKKTYFSQAKLYPADLLMTESQIEHFWATRNFKKETTKKLISHDELIQEDKLSDTEVNSILERMKNI